MIQKFGLDLSISDPLSSECSIYNKSLVYVGQENKARFNKNHFSKCSKKIDKALFSSYCNASGWKNLSLFNLIDVENDLIGVLESSDSRYEYDWIKFVKDDYDISGIWNETDNSCQYPNKVEIQFITDRGSSIDNPINYLYSAIIKTYKTSANFLDTNANELRFSLIVNYIDFYEKKSYYSNDKSRNIFPTLPSDITNPFNGK